MEKIKRVITKVIGKYGLSQAAESAYICDRANKTAEGRFRALAFKEGILTLETKNSLIAQEIQLGQNEIIKKMNQKIGSPKIKKIRFRVGVDKIRKI